MDQSKQVQALQGELLKRLGETDNGKMDIPPIVGDITTLEPVNVPGDRDTLVEVQRRHNGLLARNAQQQEELGVS